MDSRSQTLQPDFLLVTFLIAGYAINNSPHRFTAYPSFRISACIFLRHDIQSTADAPMKITENTIRTSRAIEDCIPGGEKARPAARKRIVTIQTDGIAKYLSDQNDRYKGMK